MLRVAILLYLMEVILYVYGILSVVSNEIL